MQATRITLWTKSRRAKLLVFVSAVYARFLPEVTLTTIYIKFVPPVSDLPLMMAEAQTTIKLPRMLQLQSSHLY